MTGEVRSVGVVCLVAAALGAAGCGGDEFRVGTAPERVLYDVVLDGGDGDAGEAADSGAIDSGRAEAAAAEDARADSASSPDGGAGPDASHDASPDAGCTAAAGFPDGGYTCGGSWINVPDYFACVTKQDGMQTTLSPVSSFCGPCPVCSGCDLAAVCATFGQTPAGCSDTGGELRIACQ